MDFPIEGLHEETGPGVLEAAIAFDEALAAADKAALFKTFIKVLAQRRGLMATFMAKWSTRLPGQSGHIHLSLKDADGKPVFHDESQAALDERDHAAFRRRPAEAHAGAAGDGGADVNSYTRLIPGFWAPTDATWGVENRTCALRVIPGSAEVQRVEYRIAAADAIRTSSSRPRSPPACGASSTRSSRSRWSRATPTTASFPERLALPRTLWDAAQRLKASKAAREWFGDAFVEHFAATREWEEREFRRHITDWELERYFEII